MHTKSPGKQVRVRTDEYTEAFLVLTEAFLNGRMKENSLVGPGLLESLLPLSDLYCQSLLGNQHLPDNHSDTIHSHYDTFYFSLNPFATYKYCMFYWLPTCFLCILSQLECQFYNVSVTVSEKMLNLQRAHLLSSFSLGMTLNVHLFKTSETC